MARARAITYIKDTHVYTRTIFIPGIYLLINVNFNLDGGEKANECANRGNKIKNTTILPTMTSNIFMER